MVEQGWWGSLWCTVMVGCGMVLSLSVMVCCMMVITRLYLHISAAPLVPALSVYVDGVHTADPSINIGQNVTLRCTSRGGNPSPTLSFLLDNTPVSQSMVVDTEQDSTFTFVATKDKTSLVAACRAENSASHLPVYSQNIKLTLKCRNI